ncbi:MAG: DUF2939 domain-containing protein [Thermodesulfobacteriota bacterium]|nr:DUF2939 domain-containing protein [Thermodesulfobacteriota bacterium]
MKKILWISGILLLLGVGGMLLSPFYTFYQIKNSIEANDTQKLSRYVAFPELRVNLKDQLNKIVESKFAGKAPETETRFSGLKYKFMKIFSNELVDAYATPRGLCNLMGAEDDQAPAGSDHQKKMQSSDNEKKSGRKSVFGGIFNLLKNASFSFASTRTFIVSMPIENDKIIKIVLSRNRFLWKLNNIILPVKK